MIKKIGIRVLKTEMCFLRKNKVCACPVCSKWILLIGEETRFLSRSQSRIRCASSNDIIGEKNEAVIFPDNRIYGINYVKKNILRNNGKFVPENQKMVFDESDSMKVFFL